jgi:hypothetical protein
MEEPPESPRGAAPTAPAAGSLPVEYLADPYAEARKRAVVTDWAWTGSRRVLWLDLTAGDSWGAADLESVLAGAFQRVDRWETNWLDGRDLRWPENIVITSHRPPPATLCQKLSAPEGWPERGSLLTMGHPGLGVELTTRGPADGWRRLHLADTTAADLEPALGPERF